MVAGKENQAAPVGPVLLRGRELMKTAPVHVAEVIAGNEVGKEAGKDRTAIVIACGKGKP